MAVSQNVTLPAPPGSGAISKIDLGGNGLDSPRFLWQVRLLTASDASGGNSVNTIIMDRVYSAVVGLVSIGISSPTQDQFYAFNITTGPQAADGFGMRGQTVGFGLTTSNALITPPPILLAAEDQPANTFPQISSTIPNTDTEFHTLLAQIYIFDKEARYTTAIESLLAVLPRGVSAIQRQQVTL